MNDYKQCCEHPDVFFAQIRSALEVRPTVWGADGVPIGDSNAPVSKDDTGKIVNRYFGCRSCGHVWPAKYWGDDIYTPEGWPAPLRQEDEEEG